MGAIAAQGQVAKFTPRRKKIAQTVSPGPQRASWRAYHKQILLSSSRTLVPIGLARERPRWRLGVDVLELEPEIMSG